MSPFPTGEAWPAVTVVIPVRNEVESIGSALDGIARQDYPGSIDVVVADALSDDGTRQLLAARQDVTVVDNIDRTTPAGLNRAIDAAAGEVIVRCDAHSVLPPEYVRRAVEILAETGADNVGGIQRAVGDSFVQRMIARAMSSPIGVGDAKFHYGGEPGPTDTVYLGVFPRATFDRVGMFDETLTRNQDYELNIRIRDAGGTVFFHPDLEVAYEPRRSLRGLWRQYYDYGAWKRHVIRMHPESVRLRQLAPPLLIVGLLLSLILAAFGAWQVAVIVPGAWAVALGAASLGAWVKDRQLPSLLMWIPASMMHIAWGLGFMAGSDADQLGSNSA